MTVLRKKHRAPPSRLQDRERFAFDLRCFAVRRWRAKSRSIILGVWCFFGALSFGLGASPRLAWTSNRVIGSPNPPAPYTVKRLFPKLTFTNPVDVAILPGSDRVLVLEQGGKLLSF